MAEKEKRAGARGGGEVTGKVTGGVGPEGVASWAGLAISELFRPLVSVSGWITGRLGVPGPVSRRPPPSDSSSVFSKSLRRDFLIFLPLEWVDSTSGGALLLITVEDAKEAFLTFSPPFSETTTSLLTKKVSLGSVDSDPGGLSGNALSPFPPPLLDSSESEKLPLVSRGLAAMELSNVVLDVTKCGLNAAAGLMSYGSTEDRFRFEADHVIRALSNPVPGEHGS
ncbi:hypothetical protein EYF80_052988 [Liparis tanakae]|uniref:Uncharacterized protein n=1 Tax=Liparis tanakae TaxID=230148 RepID=A0A4Z2F6V0_9TELE|nr:hypothetical protein EYF80_052988 [Liparis tanakae]